MKKTSINCLLALAVVPVFCMCSKTNEVAERTQVTITANIEDTKVSLTQGEEKLVLSWEEGDAINIIGTTTEKFTIKSGFTAKSAEFTGNEVTGSSFDIVYPSDYATKDAITARSYTGQVQNGNGSTAHLEYNAIIEGAADYQEISFAKGATGVKMNGALKLVVKLPDDVTAVSSLKLTAPSAIFYTTNGTSATSASLSMNFTNTTIGTDHILTAYMMTSWQDVTIPANTKLTLDVTAPEQNSYYSKSFSCATAQTISGGATFVIDISSATTLAYTLKGSGTETDPYLLYTAQDMVAMNSLLKADKTTYFKMMADIDMAGINWVGGNQDSPYKQHIDFNGDSHTIKNLTFDTAGKYPGLVGVLSGRVANVTFEDPRVTSTKNAGVVCGFAGTSGTNPAIVENVIITGAVVTQNGSSHTGLVFGHSNIASCGFTNITAAGIINQNGIGDSGFIGGAQNIAATFTNCHASGTLTIKSDLSAADGAQNICSGGIQGYDAGSEYEGCTFNGTINGGRLCGGIVGYNKVAGISISDCHASATITSVKIGGALGEVAGGIVGWVESGNVSKCSFEGSVTASGKEVGGIVGHVKAGTISKCSVIGDINAGGNNTGGIVGNFEAGRISECWYSGNLTVKDNSGGIAGAQSSTGATTDVIIENCYTTGTITNNGSQKCGGIAGECCKNSKIRNCFSTMNISGSGRVFGNIAGRFNNNQWNGGQNTDFNMEVTNCIAAGSINSTATGNYGSSGAVLGNCPVKVAHYTNCWRIYNFTYNVEYATTGVGLVDQGYTVTSFTDGTYQQSGYTTNSNWYPYHASEATATALQTAYSGWTTSKTDAQITISDIAAATNHSDSNAWKSDIWDLSGDYPTLKNNPEPEL